MARLRTVVAALLLALAVAQPVVAAAPPPAALLASEWDWDWDACRKFWRRQMGKTAGVAGIVTCFVVVGVLIVMSARKKT